MSHYETRVYLAFVEGREPLLLLHTEPSTVDPRARIALELGVTAAEVELHEWGRAPMGASYAFPLPQVDGDNTNLRARMDELQERVDKLFRTVHAFDKIKKIIEETATQNVADLLFDESGELVWNRP